MKAENTSIRLRKIMDERNLRQVDIIELSKPLCEKYNVKLGRNDISQYVSGKTEPGSFKLTVLAEALGVSEAWLMGYNVPMKRQSIEETLEESMKTLSDFNPKEYNLVSIFNKLNDTGQDKVIDYAKDIYSNPLYCENAPILNAARLRTDRIVTEEEIKHDDDIMKDENF